MMGVFRHADAGYELAKECAVKLGVQIPLQN
jgi:urocanate hydratase